MVHTQATHPSNPKTGSLGALLVAVGSFGDTLTAARAAAAIGQGLQAGGLPAPDLCPIEADTYTEHHKDARALLDALDFDTRMRRARAVVVGEQRLDSRALRHSVTFEIATRARQGGVPAYAVLAENGLDAFDARILDLQVILEARNARGLRTAGRQLAELV
jgi:glycerate kinase